MQAEGKDRHEIQRCVNAILAYQWTIERKTKQTGDFIMSIEKGREITIEVLKFNPRSKVSKPHFGEYPSKRLR